MRRRLTALGGSALALVLATGCSTAIDDDGEPVPPGPLPAAPTKTRAALPIVIDTDLGRDDLAALALLLRHPQVEVRAITVAQTGLGHCTDAPRVIGSLSELIGVPTTALPPVACGAEGTPDGGRTFPAPWRVEAATGYGIPAASEAAVVDQSAADLIADTVDATPGLILLALGPLTNVAALQQQHPASYGALAGVVAMAGTVSSTESDGGVAEWNAAADPAALRAVLADTVAVELVPVDAVPSGTPAGLLAPAIGRIAFGDRLPAWWDVAAAAVVVDGLDPGSGPGAWQVDDLGRLSPGAGGGGGAVTVWESVPVDAVDAACGAAFGA